MCPKRRRVVLLNAGVGVLILLIAAPALSLNVGSPNEDEHFSEFWIFGSNHLAEDYPFIVRVNESYNVFIGVGNHLGASSDYLVYVKFRNKTQSLPSAISNEPSLLPPLYELNASVDDSRSWESQVTFRILEVMNDNDSMRIGRISINDAVFVVNASALWDSEYNGFYYQLFFELWRYDTNSQNFQFQDRSVGIWLNITRQPF